jgi:phosphatidylglycerol:prolipoprotein diacylglycerol transferase
MMPYLHIFGLALPLAPLTLLLGIWFGLTLVERLSKVYKVNGEKLGNLVFYALVFGLIGARLAYVLRYPQAFVEAPLSLLSPNPGLFDPAGGAAVGLLTAMIMGQRWGLRLWPSLDALTVGLALFMLAYHLSNFASGQAYGSPSGLPWAVQLWGAARHPVQLYAVVLAGSILWLSWPTRQDADWPAGVVFLRFLAYSSAARLFLEAFRGDSQLTLYNIRTAQLAAWLVLAAALWGIGRRFKLAANDDSDDGDEKAVVNQN